MHVPGSGPAGQEGAVSEQEPMVSRRFEGRTAIVTGAASGIGRATAIRLASEGASVACVDIQRDELEQTVEALTILGATAGAFVCDVTDEQAVGRTVDRVADAFGRPAILCNVAGVGGFHHTADMPLSHWERMLAVNLTGPFLMVRATLPYMLHPHGGVIVNVAADTALAGAAYAAGYCASKGGLVMMTKALAVEFADRRIRVNAVAPGAVQTPMLATLALPEGADPRHVHRLTSRMGPCSADQVAATIVFLASDESGCTTGAVVSVDGGLTA